jgi:hypothetical protein
MTTDTEELVEVQERAAPMPWFRLYHRTVDDDRLRLLAFEDRWHFIALCCLKASGMLDEELGSLRDRRIAVKLGVQVRELEEIGRRLQEVGLVFDDLTPCAWENLQARSDNSTPRVRAFREKQRLNTTKRDETVSVTVQRKRESKRKIENIPSGYIRANPFAGEAWDGWIESRKKKPTQRAIELTIKKLAELQEQGHDPNKVLDQSTMNGWTGVFPLKGDNGNGNGRGKPSGWLER